MNAASEAHGSIGGEGAGTAHASGRARRSALDDVMASAFMRSTAGLLREVSTSVLRGAKAGLQHMDRWIDARLEDMHEDDQSKATGPDAPAAAKGSASDGSSEQPTAEEPAGAPARA